jgi:hypothetical protein
VVRWRDVTIFGTLQRGRWVTGFEEAKRTLYGALGLSAGSLPSPCPWKLEAAVKGRLTHAFLNRVKNPRVNTVWLASRSQWDWLVECHEALFWFEQEC